MPITGKKDALRQIASYLRGHLNAMDSAQWYQMFGYTYFETGGKEVIEPDPTDAQEQRMTWAADEMTRRLSVIADGKPNAT